jgi:hypothetical protein
VEALSTFRPKNFHTPDERGISPGLATERFLRFVVSEPKP